MGTLFWADNIYNDTGYFKGCGSGFLIDFISRVRRRTY